MNTLFIASIFLFAAVLTGVYFFFRFRKKRHQLPTRQDVKLIPEMRALPLNCRSWVTEDGLDPHQQQALTSPAQTTLVLAGAGAGKTKVLTKRIILLNRYLGFPIKSMMILAFNDTAAQEVSRRVSEELRVPMESLYKKNIRTIHSLAFEIFRSGNLPSRVISEEKELRNVLKEILLEIRSGPDSARYQDEVIELFGDYPRIQVRTHDRKKKVGNISIRCSDGTQVRSKMERAIVEELNRRGVKYIYEPTITWADRYFQPDFYLPEYDVYMEYWGMHDHEDPVLRLKYRRDQEKKKEAFKKFRFYLIDLYPPSKGHPVDPVKFLGKRLDSLTSKKFPNQGEAKLRQIFNTMEDQLIEVILGVLAILTSYGKTIAEISSKSDSLLRRILLFISPIYNSLEARLKEQGKTTFGLFLKGALEVLQQNPDILEKYRRSYRFFFVDEVQDLMPLTREFIRCLFGPDQSLFAIGDDYQSIYSFAGSDPATIVKFDSYFEGGDRLALVNNYRCHPRIVDVSNVVIANNKVQVFKEVRGIYRAGQNGADRPVRILTLEHLPLDMDRVIDEVMAAIPANENLTILSRYRENNPNVEPWLSAFKAKGLSGRIEFLTIHKSKGLEADNVLIINCIEHSDEKYSFPATDGVQGVKDMVLNICRGSDFSLEEEETRLFYVALTRAKKRVFVQTVKGKESRFTQPRFLSRHLVS